MRETLTKQLLIISRRKITIHGHELREISKLNIFGLFKFKMQKIKEWIARYSSEWERGSPQAGSWLTVVDRSGGTNQLGVEVLRGMLAPSVHYSRRSAESPAAARA